MFVASFSFYAELNHFLPKHKKQSPINHNFTERASIKDTIEALGVPHPEVDCIQVNGEFVDFGYIVRDGDKIDVYPVSMIAEIQPTVCLRSPLPQILRFVLDVHLGKLATSLRLLGFDTLYRNDYPDALLAEISSSQGRILLTRDKGLLMRSLVTYGYYVRETNPEKQILEVMRRFNLSEFVSPFQRCLRCNGLLAPVSKQLVIEQLPESVKQQRQEFYRCQDCTQVYWQGSHYQKLQQFIAQLLRE
ncbi:MAG: Mut7-C RNAse domain-containing protein [Calothrix sp. MO_192.B10]|nr:Mut7-C RNAse domain-containing protein [Calothrix sp. MO_192.B10]